MFSNRSLTALLLATLIFISGGCASILSMVTNPPGSSRGVGENFFYLDVPMWGGTQVDAAVIEDLPRDLGWGILAILDFPLSFALDTAMFPYTLIVFLTRPEAAPYHRVRDPDTKADDLEKLSFSADEDIRVKVAGHKNTSPSTLIRLSEDESEKVRREVAYNDHTPAKTLSQLAEDKSEKIRYGVASNLNADMATLVKLSQDDSPRVADVAAANIRRLAREKKSPQTSSNK